MALLLRLFSLAGTASLAVVTMGLAYFGAMVFLGQKELRRATKLAPAGWKVDGDAPPFNEDIVARYVTYFLVPCLNEELVISETVGEIVANPNAIVVVVDDASADATAQLAYEAGRDRVILVTRQLPEARLGKGPALNAGYQAVVDDAARRGLDPDFTIVCVMDADGRLSAGALGHVCPLFEDPLVGGVQLGVRIRNRGRLAGPGKSRWTRLLTLHQDFEFWGLSAVSQLGRVRTRSVSLGGNGQFTRLRALMGVGDAPWNASLTEDLDLAVTLLLKGWRLTTTPFASVHQQGVETLGALVRQRTRWFQGHMTANRRIPEVWRSRHLDHWTVLEVTAYLLVPFLLVLPWSVIFHLGLLQAVLIGTHPPLVEVFGSGAIGKGVLIFAWYLISFMPNIVAGYLYARRDQQVSRLRSLAMGHLLVAGNYVSYLACWRAVLRMVRGHVSWAKTARAAEGDVIGAPAAPAFPLPSLVPGLALATVGSGTRVFRPELQSQVSWRPDLVHQRARGDAEPAFRPASLPGRVTVDAYQLAPPPPPPAEPTPLPPPPAAARPAPPAPPTPILFSPLVLRPPDLRPVPFLPAPYDGAVDERPGHADADDIEDGTGRP